MSSQTNHTFARALCEAYARNGGNKFSEHFDQSAAEQWMAQALEEVGNGSGDCLALIDSARKQFPAHTSAHDALDWLEEQYAVAFTTVPPKWRQIDEAPKDGTMFIGTRLLCVYGDGRHEWIVSDAAWQDGRYRFRDIMTGTPTHWMPLDPPATPNPATAPSATVTAQ